MLTSMVGRGGAVRLRMVVLRAGWTGSAVRRGQAGPAQPQDPHVLPAQRARARHHTGTGEGPDRAGPVAGLAGGEVLTRRAAGRADHGVSVRPPPVAPTPGRSRRPAVARRPRC